MKRTKKRVIFEILMTISVIFFAVISLLPSKAKHQSVQLDDGKMKYAGQILNHKFTGKGVLKIQNEGSYVGNFVDGRFEGDGKFISPKGWQLKDDFKNGELGGVVKLQVGDKTYTQKITKAGS